jgi:protein-L-isoaspartate(D-aspartate) O-methyltransferase
MEFCAMNFEQARFNMVEQQVRPWDVLDPRVLELIGKVYREDFVPLEYRKLAYADIAIPIGHEQLMLPPREEGRILQALQVKTNDKVLEVGTGSGYLTTLLAYQAGSVNSVDIFSDFTTAAKSRLARLEIDNVTFYTGDASHGWDSNTTYDVICITGSFYKLPESYLLQMAIGGRLFVVEGQEPAMQAKVITRYGQQEWRAEIIYETVVPALLNSETPPAFAF